jgi:hypothetical protein
MPGMARRQAGISLWGEFQTIRNFWRKKAANIRLLANPAPDGLNKKACSTEKKPAISA